MVPVWMTFSDLLPRFQGHDYLTSVTRKWYNIELYLQWPTNRKSYMVYRTVPFSMTLKDPYPGFKVTLFFGAEYLRIQTWFHWKTNRDLRTHHSTVSLWMTLSDLEWRRKIFNDEAVSLRQLSLFTLSFSVA